MIRFRSEPIDSSRYIMNNNSSSSNFDSLLWIRFSTFTLIGIMVFIGNAIVLTGLRQFRRTIKVDILIASLSLADLLSVILLLPMAFYSMLISSHILPSWLCQVSGVIMTGLLMVSNLTTTLMSVDRILATGSPLRYLVTVSVTVLKRSLYFAWIVAFALACLPLTGWDHFISASSLCIYSLTGQFAIFFLALHGIHFLIVTYCFVSILFKIANINRHCCRHVCCWPTWRDIFRHHPRCCHRRRRPTHSSCISSSSSHRQHSQRQSSVYLRPCCHPLRMCYRRPTTECCSSFSLRHQPSQPSSSISHHSQPDSASITSNHPASYHRNSVCISSRRTNSLSIGSILDGTINFTTISTRRRILTARLSKMIGVIVLVAYLSWIPLLVS